jgi:hypothetical protein
MSSPQNGDIYPLSQSYFLEVILILVIFMAMVSMIRVRE